MKRFTMGVGLIQATQINIKMKDKNTIYKIKRHYMDKPNRTGVLYITKRR